MGKRKLRGRCTMALFDALFGTFSKFERNFGKSGHNLEKESKIWKKATNFVCLTSNFQGPQHGNELPNYHKFAYQHGNIHPKIPNIPNFCPRNSSVVFLSLVAFVYASLWRSFMALKKISPLYVCNQKCSSWKTNC